MQSTDTAMKLLFAGPVGAGKTTAISAISDRPPLSTDVAFSDGPRAGKTTTTIAFDYSTISLQDDEVLHVYGLPGQESLNFIGAIVGRGAVGAVLLLDASSSMLLEDCRYWIGTLAKIDQDMKFVIGITKADTIPWFSIEEIRSFVSSVGKSVPTLSVDPRDPAQVSQLIRLLLLTL